MKPTQFEDPDRPQSKLILVLVGLVGLVLPAAGGELQPRIVNGLFESEQPTVGMLLDGANPDVAVGSCTGTMIGCETFLTAAHCVCGPDSINDCEGAPDPADFSVFLQHAGFFDVSSVSLDSSYAFPVADYAVLKLSTPMSGIAPTPINTTGTPAFGSVGVISGFGISGGTNDDFGLKRTGAVMTASCAGGGISDTTSVCWEFLNPIGPPGLDSNTCSGDSGGPLFVDFGGGPVVAGVTSGGDSNNCLPTDNSFDTNVFFYRDFIQTAGGADLNETTCGALPQVGSSDVQIQSAVGELSGGSPQGTLNFSLPAGTELLRVAMNALDDGFSNFNMYVLAGSPATTSVFDCARTGAGQLGLCEFPNPAEGNWFVLVDRVSGSGTYQITATAFGAASVGAAGGPVSGKLLIRNKVPDDESKNRIVFLSKDSGIPIPSPGSPDDPRNAGGSIQVSSGTSGELFTQLLPAANWRLLGKETRPKGYKYLDRELDDGPCKVVLIKAGKLAKAVCLGKGPTNLNYDLIEGQAQAPVSVLLSIGSATYCAELGGELKKDGTDGKTFLAKEAQAPASCP